MSVAVRNVNKLESSQPGGLQYAFSQLGKPEEARIEFLCDSIIGEIEHIGNGSSLSQHLGNLRGVLVVEKRESHTGRIFPFVSMVTIDDDASYVSESLEAGFSSYNRKMLGIKNPVTESAY